MQFMNARVAYVKQLNCRGKNIYNAKFASVRQLKKKRELLCHWQTGVYGLGSFERLILYMRNSSNRS